MTYDEKLEQAIEYMQSLEEVLDLALTAEADTEYANEIGFSDAIEKTSASNDMKRKAEALLATRKEFEAYLRAKKTSKMIQIKMKNAQTAVSAYQSLLKKDVAL